MFQRLRLKHLRRDCPKIDAQPHTKKRAQRSSDSSLLAIPPLTQNLFQGPPDFLQIYLAGPIGKSAKIITKFAQGSPSGFRRFFLRHRLEHDHTTNIPSRFKTALPRPGNQRVPRPTKFWQLGIKCRPRTP